MPGHHAEGVSEVSAAVYASRTDELVQARVERERFAWL